MSKKNTTTVFRSAKTGKFVNKEFANKHPATTVKEKVPVPPVPKK